MAYITTFTFEVVPGQMQRAVDALNEVKKMHEGVGANVRLLTPLYAGENFGRIIYAAEFPDADGIAAQLKVSEEAGNSAPLVEAIFGQNPSLKPVASAILRDMPS